MNSMAETSHLVELAKAIQAGASDIHKHIAESGQADPSFDPNATPTDFAAAGVQELRSSLLDQLEELRDLLLTPMEKLHSIAPTEWVSRHALDRFEIYQKVPIGETRTYAELAKATGLPMSTVRRLIRHAMTQRIFTEPSPGVVAHTPTSKLLTEDRHVRDWAGVLAEIVYTVAGRTADALQCWPQDSGSKEKEKSAFFLVKEKTTHQLLDDEPDFHKRYDSAMYANRNNMMYSVDHIAQGFDFASFGDGLMVDVAGGVGAVSRGLAKHFPKMKFVIQDLPEVISQAPAVEDSIKEQISFMEHDMFTPQPVKGADIYFFRRVFMEWTDEKTIDIFRNLIPGMTPGKSRIVIADFYVPDPGTCPLWMERMFRNSDMLSLVTANCASRDKEEWTELFKKASPGFEVRSVKPLKNSDMMITEAVWQGE